jgi:hypothetical protein
LSVAPIPSPRVRIAQALAPITITEPTSTLPFQAINNTARPVTVPKFDSTLGKLISVRVVASGIVRGDITSENLSSSGNDITATVTGTFALSGPGVQNLGPSAPKTATAQQFNVPPFDGQDDFEGPDTVIFPTLTTAADTASQSLTNPAVLAAYIGTGTSPGTVPFQFNPIGTAKATEDNGNIQTRSSAQASGAVTVQYTYIPSALSGFVYVDCNNNGLRNAGEPGVPGVMVTLTGTTVQGPIAPQTALTDANGFYQFTNLRAGTYTVTETQPPGLLDGQDTRGNVTPLPGSIGTDVIPGILVGAGTEAMENNFGEYFPTSVSGFVYVDANNNGLKDTGELGIPNVKLTLTGSNDLGPIAAETTTTTAAGAYQFPGLRPGTYTVTVTQPAEFNAGQTTMGNVTPIPGSAGSTAITDVMTTGCMSAPNNNFGELVPTPPAQCVTVTPRIFGIHGQPTPIVLTFGAALNATQAQNLNNYHLVNIGADDRLGTADDRNVPLLSATYNATAHTVTLIPSQQLVLGPFYAITVHGSGATSVVGNGGTLMDLNGGCGDYTALIGRETHIHFRQADGAQVFMGVSQGGVLELVRAPNGDARQLLISNAASFAPGLIPGVSYVQGAVIPGPGAASSAVIPTIIEATNVQIRLQRPLFLIGQIIVNPLLPPAALPFPIHPNG